MAGARRREREADEYGVLEGICVKWGREARMTMKNLFFVLLGIVIGANAVYAFKLVAMLLRHCGGIQ